MKLVADNQAKINRELYGKAPTMKEISSFLKEIDFKYSEYERLVGMRPRTISDVKSGYRKLPARWWGLIYKKIVPTWGAASGHKKPKNSHTKNYRKHKPLCNTKQSTDSTILNKLKNLKSD